MNPEIGSRKYKITMASLGIFAVATLVYLALICWRGLEISDSFYTSFILGLTSISGGYQIANVFEHRANAETKKPAE